MNNTYIHLFDISLDSARVCVLALGDSALQLVGDVLESRKVRLQHLRARALDGVLRGKEGKQ
jgi:hypothetical protein